MLTFWCIGFNFKSADSIRRTVNAVLVVLCVCRNRSDPRSKQMFWFLAPVAKTFLPLRDNDVLDLSRQLNDAG